MSENEAMLKRLQARTSTYNVTQWEKNRHAQVRLIKHICKYDTNISKFKKFKYKQKQDLETRYASAGPNKQMFDMYTIGKNFQDPNALSTYGYNGTGVQSQANVDMGSMNNEQSQIEIQNQSQNQVEEVPVPDHVSNEEAQGDIVDQMHEKMNKTQGNDGFGVNEISQNATPAPDAVSGYTNGQGLAANS